jgi:hypothetical protein
VLGAEALELSALSGQPPVQLRHARGRDPAQVELARL